MLTAGPYALAQAIAWAGMLKDYSKTDGIAQAVTDTFSGERPCEMCRQIEEAKKEDATKHGKDHPDLVQMKKAPELAPLSGMLVPQPEIGDAAPVFLLPPLVSIGICQAAPPLPPPRA